MYKYDHRQNPLHKGVHALVALVSLFITPLSNLALTYEKNDITIELDL